MFFITRLYCDKFSIPCRWDIYKKCREVTLILGRALVLLLAVLGGVPLHGVPAGV